MNEKKLGELRARFSESPAFVSTSLLDLFPRIQWIPGAFWVKPASLLHCKVMRGKLDLFTPSAVTPHSRTQPHPPHFDSQP